MRGSAALALRSLIPKLNPHGALTATESTRLLNRLNDTFRSQLDAAHPAVAQNSHNDNLTLNNPTLRRADADQHLASLLSDSSFKDTLSTTDATRAKVKSQLMFKHPIEVLQDLTTSGRTEIDLGALCLAAHEGRQPVHSLKARRDVLATEAGTKALAWLMAGKDTFDQSRLENTKIFLYICSLLVLQSRDELLWSAMARTKAAGLPLSLRRIELASGRVAEAHSSNFGRDRVTHSFLASFNAFATQLGLRAAHTSLVRAAHKFIHSILLQPTDLPTNHDFVQQYDLFMHNVRGYRRMLAALHLRHPVAPDPTPALDLICSSSTVFNYSQPAFAKLVERTVDLLWSQGLSHDARSVLRCIQTNPCVPGAQIEMARVRLLSRLQEILDQKSADTASDDWHPSLVPG